MTKAIIDPGACGFRVEIIVEKIDKHKVSIRVKTDCEMVINMLHELLTLDMHQAFTGHFNNPVYRASARHLKHPSCPVPSGILKAVEVEFGLCLPKEVLIRFED